MPGLAAGAGRAGRVGSTGRALRRLHPGVRGALRPAAPPDPAGAGRPLRGVARRIVDAYLVELEPLRGARPRDRHRVPAHRRHPGRAEGPPPLPGREDVDLDEELALWEERDLLLARLLECKTFKDVAAVLAGLADGAARSFPRIAGLDERFARAGARPARGGRRRELAPFLRATAPRPVPPRDLTTSRPCASAWPRRWRSWSTSCPESVASASAGSPAALVERLEVIVRFLARARAVQAGPGGPGAAGDVRRHRDRVAGPRCRPGDELMIGTAYEG